MSSNPDILDTKILAISMVSPLPRKVHVKLRLGKLTMTLTLNIYNHDVAGGTLVDSSNLNGKNYGN